MNFSQIGARLEDERKRIGFKTQKASGDACGVSREMWGKYERGTALPGGDVFLAFATAGADVQYILTGVRSSNALAADEELLLERYRNSPQVIKSAALQVVLTGQQGGGTVIHGNVGQQIDAPTGGTFKVDMRKK